MLFSSLIFVFVFFPLQMLCYALAKSLRVKNFILLGFSLVFYTWGEPLFVVLLLAMALADWLLTTPMKGASQKKRKLLLFAACAFNLIILIVFKYGAFLLENLRELTGHPSHIPPALLPIGISFYTFQLLSYVVDVYRKEVDAPDKFSHLLLYVSLFHQCVAGPIVRYKDVSDSILERSVSTTDMHNGIRRFSYGLGKKVLLANVCGSLADTLLPVGEVSANVTTLGCWLGMLCFTLYIYLDFSSYSDMAIGMGLMTGFHYKENFNYPYQSQGIRDFWRRWHISLGSFFRDYVYIPLGGSRKGEGRTLLNLLVVWGLTGFWHGASWNFVLWGLYFFILILLERFVIHNLFEGKPKILYGLYTFIMVYFGWVLFRFHSLAEMGLVFKGLFGLAGAASSFEVNNLLLSNIFIILLAVLASTAIIKKSGSGLSKAFATGSIQAKTVSLVQTLLPPAIVVIAALALVGESYQPFIYFQF
ncbi:MAG: MBOAT family protein [Oscillospiraceae bacterium]|jgi:alginate O-acetyltransferase complex protein AlgI|nr:MBOAT family protein [Oscillospiraceae bacterium]